MSSLILKMSLENKLSPELKKALNDLRSFSSSLSDLKSKLATMRANKKGFLDGSINSDIESLNKLKQKMLNATTPAERKRLRADLVSAYNFEMQKLSSQIKTQNTLFKEKIYTTNRLYNAQAKLTTQTSRYDQTLKNTTNSIVRHIRQVESFLVAMYGIKKAYDATLGVGFKFNRVIQNETNGLKLLIVQNMKNTDAMGRVLSLKEKYAIAEEKAYQMMQKIKQINPETPYALSDTTKVFKALYPQLIKYGASMNDIANITKKFTIIAKANNLEVDQFIRTVDTAFTGEMAQSQLKQVLERMGLTNKAIKEVIKNGTLLSFINDKFKEVDSDLLGITKSWDNAISAFKTSWETLWGKIQEPIFNDLNKDIRTFTKYLNDNSESLAKNIPFYSNLIFEAGKLALAMKVSSLLVDRYKASNLGLGRSLKMLKVEMAISNAIAGKKATALNLLSLGANKARVAITALARSFKAFAFANAPMLAITAIFEAWNYWTNKNIEAQEKLQHSLHLTINEIKKMSNIKIKMNILDIEKQLDKAKQKLNSAILDEVNMKQGKNFLQFDKAYSEEEKLAIVNKRQEAEKEVGVLEKKLKLLKQEVEYRNIQTNQIIDQVNLQAQQVNTTVANNIQIAQGINFTYGLSNALSSASINAFNTASQAQSISIELYNAKIQAIDLDKALGAAVIGIQKQFIRAKEIAGAISRVQAIKLTFDLDKKATEANFKALNKKYELAFKIKDDKKRASTIKKLNIEAQKMAEQKLIKENQYNQQLKQEKKRHEQITLKLKEQQNLLHAKNATKAQIKNVELEINALKKSGIKTDEDQLKLLTLQNRKKSLTTTLQHKAHTAGVRNLKHQKALAHKMQHINDLHKVANQELEKQKSIQKQIDDLKKNWWVFDKDSVKEAKEKLRLAIAERNALKGHSSKVKVEKAITKEYEARLNLLKAQHSQLKAIYSIYNGGIGSILKGDFKGGFSSIFSGLADMLIKPLQAQISSYLTKTTSGFLSSFSPLAGGLIGGAISILPSLLQGIFGHTLTEAEIKKAKGRADFSDDSLNKLGDIISKVDNPLLPYNQQMTDYLRSLNKNFINIADAIGSNVGGLDYTGANYAPSQSNVLFGLFSSSTQLIGSGIELNIKNLKGQIEAYKYLTEKKHSSALFGLFSSDSIKETKNAVDAQMQKALSEIIKNGRDIIISSGKVLGYDVKKQLNQFKYNLGKIDLQGLSPEEASKRISNALSEALGKAIDETDLRKLTDRYKKLGEKQLSTLVRIASEYEQATNQLDKIGFKFSESSKKVREKFTGFLSFLNTSFFDKITTSVKKYTKQMAVLDIVKFAGGQDNFSKLFNSFYNNYYSEAERMSKLRLSLSGQFDKLGYHLPKTKAEFRHLVESFKVTDEASAKTYEQLLELAPAFDTLTKSMGESYIHTKDLYDLYMGDLSSFNRQQKAQLASKYLEIQRNQNNGVGALQATKDYLEQLKKTTATKDAYVREFNSVVSKLNENVEKDATNKDLLDELKRIKAEIEELKRVNEDQIRQSV